MTSRRKRARPVEAFIPGLGRFYECSDCSEPFKTIAETKDHIRSYH